MSIVHFLARALTCPSVVQNDDMQDLYRMKALALEDLNRRARAKLQLYPAEVREKIEAAIQVCCFYGLLFVFRVAHVTSIL